MLPMTPMPRSHLGSWGPPARLTPRRRRRCLRPAPSAHPAPPAPLSAPPPVPSRPVPAPPRLCPAPPAGRRVRAGGGRRPGERRMGEGGLRRGRGAQAGHCGGGWGRGTRTASEWSRGEMGRGEGAEEGEGTRRSGGGTPGVVWGKRREETEGRRGSDTGRGGRVGPGKESGNRR